jgi:hypothetical protein
MTSLGAINFKSIGGSLAEAITIAVSSRHAVFVTVASTGAPRVAFFGTDSGGSVGASGKLGALAECKMGFRQVLGISGRVGGSNNAQSASTGNDLQSLSARTPSE